MRARAIAILCFWPPESCVPLSPTLVSYFCKLAINKGKTVLIQLTLQGKTLKSIDVSLVNVIFNNVFSAPDNVCLQN